MPAAVPLADYNTGVTSGMGSGTTQTLSSGQSLPRAGGGMGATNITVATLVAVSLVVIVTLHVLGFRFAFDASVGRRG